MEDYKIIAGEDLDLGDMIYLGFSGCRAYKYNPNTIWTPGEWVEYLKLKIIEDIAIVKMDSKLLKGVKDIAIDFNIPQLDIDYAGTAYPAPAIIKPLKPIEVKCTILQGIDNLNEYQASEDVYNQVLFMDKDLRIKSLKKLISSQGKTIERLKAEIKLLKNQVKSAPADKAADKVIEHLTKKGTV